MGKITLRQAAAWCGGTVEEKYADVTFLGATNDTRTLQPGQLFVALQTLLLLYLVTEGTWGDEYDELDEDYIQPEEILVAHCHRMNKMLMECGMRRIDPRSVFDYLLLYCLLPEDDMAMSQRMSALAAELFAGA